MEPKGGSSLAGAFRYLSLCIPVQIVQVGCNPPVWCPVASSCSVHLDHEIELGSVKAASPYSMAVFSCFFCGFDDGLLGLVSSQWIRCTSLAVPGRAADLGNELGKSSVLKM